MLKALRAHAQGDVKPVLLPERDDHVELVLRHWDEVGELYELPLPDDPDAARRLRHKATLPQEAERAGVDAPRTVAAESIDTLRSLDLRPPFLLKPVEGQHFAGSFGEKVLVAQTPDELVAAVEAGEGARLRHGRPGARARLRGRDLVAVRLPRPERPSAGHARPA